jgi:hypothetical protein
MSAKIISGAEIVSTIETEIDALRLKEQYRIIPGLVIM